MVCANCQSDNFMRDKDGAKHRQDENGAPYILVEACCRDCKTWFSETYTLTARTERIVGDNVYGYIPKR